LHAAPGVPQSSVGVIDPIGSSRACWSMGTMVDRCPRLVRPSEFLLP
jgi:hypothetical protein